MASKNAHRSVKKFEKSPLFIILLIVAAVVTYWPIAIAMLMILIIVLAVRNSKKEKERQQEEEQLEKLRQEKRVMEDRLLAVQNAISPVRSDSLSGTPGQIEQRFRSYVSNHTVALNAAIRLANKAVNIKTFFEAEDNYQEEIEALCKAEQQDLFPLNPAPSTVKAEHEDNLPNSINEMLSRMWHNYQEQAANLKTARGKQNRIKAFFHTILFYADRFYPANFTLINRLKKEAHEQYGLEKFE